MYFIPFLITFTLFIIFDFNTLFILFEVKWTEVYNTSGIAILFPQYFILQTVIQN